MKNASGENFTQGTTRLSQKNDLFDPFSSISEKTAKTSLPDNFLKLICLKVVSGTSNRRTEFQEFPEIWKISKNVKNVNFKKKRVSDICQNDGF